MSEPSGPYWYDVDLASLSVGERLHVDQGLRAEGIPATWSGTVLRVDSAYEARVQSLVESAREAAAAATPPPAVAPPTSPAPVAPGPAPYPYAGGGYGATAPAPYAYTPAPTPARTNSMAIVSLVLGIASFVVCPIAGPIGLYCGLRARREIRQTGEDGDGLAVAGAIISGVATALVALAFLALLAIVLIAAFSSSN